MSDLDKVMERVGFWLDPLDGVFKRGQLRVTREQAEVAFGAAKEGVSLGVDDFSPRGSLPVGTLASQAEDE